MEPLGLVQGKGSHHLPAPPSLQLAGTVMDARHPRGAEPSWGRNLHNFNPDWLLGHLSILQLRRRKPSEGEGLAPKSHTCPAQEGARSLTQAFRFQVQGYFNQALCLSAEHLDEFWPCSNLCGNL